VVSARPAAREAPPPRGRRRRGRPLLLAGAAAAVAAVALAFLWRGAGGRGADDPAEEASYRAVLAAKTDREAVELAETYRLRFPGARHAADVDAAAARARARIAAGEDREGDLYDPAPELLGLSAKKALDRLGEMLETAPREKRAGIEAALARARDRLAAERQRLFDELLSVFDGHVAKGEFSRGREIWFFLRGDEAWEPIPDAYRTRIVEAMLRLENAATIRRGELLDEAAALERGRDLAGARELLRTQLPNFTGTSVARSLEERLHVLDLGIHGAKGEPARPRTTVRIDVERRMDAILEGLARREFRAAAEGLAALAGEVQGERGHAEVLARACESEAAARLHEALVASLAGGTVPSSQIANRWRVLGGDAAGLEVRTKGNELRYPWVEVPSDLYLALLDRHAAEVGQGRLGLAVAAHAVGGPEDLVAALAGAYGDESLRAAVDAFVAARVRREPVPEGGYVVHAGEILTRKEHLRRVEEALIRRFQEQLEKSFAAVKADRTWSRLDRLKERKAELDKARDFALELIFDEQKYFYPYANTGREGEYAKVQQEVDRRVAAVEEIWADPAVVTVKGGPELERALAQFDEAAKELGKRLVDTSEKAEEVAFLRSYLGGKFTLPTLYRDAREKDLLEYSREVMEWNPTVEGDIKDNERQQVQVTNEYRMMFGRWPVRIVDKLVLSSRGHCEEMSRLGYFGHFSPTPGRKTPYDRMRLQGYVHGASENCVAGTTDPRSAHQRWCHSSGHHRNILMPPWTEMGTGAHGSLMTQNFGQAPKWSRSDPPRPEIAEDPGDYTEEQDPCGETEIEVGGSGEAKKKKEPERRFDYEDEE
jgi:hypothetical protein